MAGSGTKTIRVLLVDDHDMLRTGVATVLGEFPEFEVVGSAVNGWDAVDKCEALQPDVVLMDILMPDIDGLAVARILRNKFPDMKFVVLTSFEDEALIQAAHEVGVSGYLLKIVGIEEITQALLAAYLGEPGPFPAK
jgi:two-component system, NarL family, response regulator LiaR